MDKENFKRTIEKKLLQINKEMNIAIEKGDTIKINELNFIKSQLGKAIVKESKYSLKDSNKSRTRVIPAVELNLKKSLQEILDKKNSLILIRLNDLKDYYIQIFSDKEAGELYCECVSNYYLNEKYKLNKVAENILIKFGWNKPSIEKKNFYLKYNHIDLSSLNLLLNVIQKTSKEVYNITLDNNVIFEITIE